MILEPIATQSPRETQEATITTPYGSCYARLFPAFVGWLAYICFYVGRDVEIKRDSPLFTNEVDAAAWVQESFTAGPQFVLALLEATQ